MTPHDDDRPQEPAERSAADDANWLRHELSLSMTELAELFGARRSAVFGWVAGDPTPQAERIARVRRALQALPERESLRWTRMFWNRQLSTGASFREILGAENPERAEREAPGAWAELLPMVRGHVDELARRAARPRASFGPLGNPDADDLYAWV